MVCRSSKVGESMANGKSELEVSSIEVETDIAHYRSAWLLGPTDDDMVGSSSETLSGKEAHKTSLADVA